jgi:alkylation response protein AidB-like acyl-CoA dehydrogenase
MSVYTDEVDAVVRDVVAPNAEEIDRTGAFPRGAVEAMGSAGLLGLLSAAEVGGRGGTIRDASEVIERLATACGSTAMVVLMHYAAVPTIEAFGPQSLRESVARGSHLLTVAFSERGSRSQFWAPLGTARRENGSIRLDAEKSWVTSAGEADGYLWSSRPLDAEGPMSLWHVRAGSEGLSTAGPFDGLGLRGNASRPMSADRLVVEETDRLGEDGKGLDIALSHVLPAFQVLSAAVSLGLMEAATTTAAAHLGEARYEHLDRSLGQNPVTRLDLARMRLTADRERALLSDTLTALEIQRADAMLRVLESKASAAEAAVKVTDLAMKVCGGSAFRKELGVERRFRDARAARVMAPTTDALLDFIGRSLLGQPLLDEDVP